MHMQASSWKTEMLHSFSIMCKKRFSLEFLGLSAARSFPWGGKHILYLAELMDSRSFFLRIRFNESYIEWVPLVTWNITKWGLKAFRSSIRSCWHFGLGLTEIVAYDQHKVPNHPDPINYQIDIMIEASLISLHILEPFMTWGNQRCHADENLNGCVCFHALKGNLGLMSISLYFSSLNEPDQFWHFNSCYLSFQKGFIASLRLLLSYLGNSDLELGMRLLLFA